MTAPKNSTTLVEIIMAILLSVDFCVVFDVDVSFTLKKKSNLSFNCYCILRN